MSIQIGNNTKLNNIKGVTKILQISDSEKSSLSSVVFPENIIIKDSNGILYLTDGVTPVSQLSSLKIIPTLATVATSGDYNDLTNKPSSMTPKSHTHGNISNVGKLGTASRVVITDSDKAIDVSSVTSTELGHLSGVTSSVQTQINGKADDSSVVHTTGNESISGTKSFNSDLNLNYAVTDVDDIIDSVPGTGSSDDYVHLTGNETVNGVKSFPDGIVANVSGTCSKDGDGNTISSTYGKLAGTQTWTGNNTFDSEINLNYINADVSDIVDSIPGLGTAVDYVHLTGSESVNGVKSFPDGIVANVSGNCTRDGDGNTITSTYGKLASNQTWSGENTTHNIKPEVNATYSLGNPSYRWASVYANNYYYGTTAFTDKFVTTDTNQSIGGDKNFTKNVYITHNTTPKLLLKDTRNNRAHNNFSSGGITRLETVDASNNPLSRISTILRSDGASVIEQALFTENDNGNEVTRAISFAMSKNGDSSLRPNTHNVTSLGTESVKWKTVWSRYFNGMLVSSANVNNSDTNDPSSTVYRTLSEFQDTNNENLSDIYYAREPNGSSKTFIRNFSKDRTSNVWIGLHSSKDNTNNYVAISHSPDVSDNSYKVATTAFVKAQNYVTGVSILNETANYEMTYSDFPKAGFYKVATYKANTLSAPPGNNGDYSLIAMDNNWRFGSFLAQSPRKDSVFYGHFWNNEWKGWHELCSLDTQQTITALKTFDNRIKINSVIDSYCQSITDVTENPQEWKYKDIIRIWNNVADIYNAGLQFSQLTDGTLRLQLINFGYTTEGNAYQNRINFDSTRNGEWNFSPNNNNGSLGTSANKWKSIYADTYYYGTTAFGNIVTHNTSEFASASHSHGNSDITDLDASKITSGTIDIARLPQGALDRLITVTNQTARYALTSNDVSLGDTVKQIDNGELYIVTDITNLNNANGYTIYTAGTATRAYADEDGINIKTGYGKLAGTQTWTGVNTFTGAIDLIKYKNTSIDLTDTTSGVKFITQQAIDKNNSKLGECYWSYNASDNTAAASLWATARDNIRGGIYVIHYGANSQTDVIPANNTHTTNLGTSTNRWSGVYADSYYYGTTEWGLDKANVWAARQRITGNNSNTRGILSIYNSAHTKGSATSVTDLSIGTIFLGDSGNGGLVNSLGFISSDLANSGNTTMLSLSAVRNEASSGERANLVVEYDKSDTTSPEKIRCKGTVFPQSDSTYNLGTSTNKWKTINGVNPGSLSLPDVSQYINVGGSILPPGGTAISLNGAVNYFTPTIDGWLSLAINSCSDLSVWASNARYGQRTTAPSTGQNLQVMLPVIANQKYEIYIIGSTLNTARLFPCLGNV